MTVQDQQGNPVPPNNFEALSREAAGLVTAVGDLTKALKKYRRFAVATAVGLVLDVVLTIIMATVLSGQADTNRQIKESLRENYITQQQQAETRVRVLCPLYALLLTSVDPAKRAALPVDQQKVYDTTVGVIQKGYGTLGCQPPLP